ncbi:MAG: hypothetical protein IJC50_09075 [Clostridia bacterium]|nr:hypothetical protein [Clostridia bacterium]
MKRLIVLMFVIILCLSGCISKQTLTMPFNGDVKFYDVSLTIPEDFIRDSTQSDENGWVFEKNYYSQMIIITRSNVVGDVGELLDGYMEQMHQMEFESQRTTFRERDAVLSEYTLNEQYCREMCFPHEDSLYFVALRGGTEEEFYTLLDTIVFLEKSDNDSV